MRPLASLRLVALLLALGGCATPVALVPSGTPFRFTRDTTASRGILPVETRPAGPLGDDPHLPGFRSNLPIATFTADRTGARLPERFVIVLVPSNPARPMLEYVEVRGAEGSVATFLGAAEETVTTADGRTAIVPAGTHVLVSVVGGELHVVLRPAALALLSRGGTVSWVDAYRQ